MKQSLFYLFLAFGFASSASAGEVVVSPRVPVDCKQLKMKEVTFVEILPRDNDENFTLRLTYGSCASGNVFLKPISRGYNAYLTNREYSRDFRESFSATEKALTIEMKLNPSEFFAQYDTRHFDLSFYPTSGPLSFNWYVTFEKNPATGKISLKLTPQ